MADFPAVSPVLLKVERANNQSQAVTCRDHANPRLPRTRFADALRPLLCCAPARSMSGGSPRLCRLYSAPTARRTACQHAASSAEIAYCRSAPAERAHPVALHDGKNSVGEDDVQNPQISALTRQEEMIILAMFFRGLC